MAKQVRYRKRRSTEILLRIRGGQGICQEQNHQKTTVALMGHCDVLSTNPERMIRERFS